MTDAVKELFSNTEKVLRFALPVAVYMSVSVLKTVGYSDMTINHCLLMMFGFGTGAYVVYRNIAALLDDAIHSINNKCRYWELKYRTELILKLYDSAKGHDAVQLRSYIYYKFAEVHSGNLVVLALLFAFVSYDFDYKPWFYAGCCSMWMVLLYNYIQLHRLQTRIIEGMKYKNASNQAVKSSP